MPNPYFQFKQFTIQQNQCAMKVGTDGVLLGAWAAHTKPKQILDIGTGTGLVAIMLAQRFPQATVCGIELDQAAALQATQNMNASPWPNRLHCEAGDFLQHTFRGAFDLVVSNPPFFQNALSANTAQRSLARHNTALPFHALFGRVAQILAPGGVFALIAPADVAPEFADLAQQNKLYCTKITAIKTTPKKQAKRVLLSYGLQNTPTLTDELVIEDNGRHAYSEKYKKLTADFYLKF